MAEKDKRDTEFGRFLFSVMTGILISLMLSAATKSKENT